MPDVAATGRRILRTKTPSTSYSRCSVARRTAEGRWVDLAVECRTCGAHYQQRENLLSCEWLWFPTCTHPLTDAVTVDLEASDG